MKHSIETSLSSEDVYTLWSSFNMTIHKLKESGDFPEHVRYKAIADELLNIKWQLDRQ